MAKRSLISATAELLLYVSIHCLGNINGPVFSASSNGNLAWNVCDVCRRTNARVGVISRSATTSRRRNTPSCRRSCTPTTRAKPAGRAACRLGSTPSRSCTSTTRARSRTSTSTTEWSSPSAAVGEQPLLTSHASTPTNNVLPGDLPVGKSPAIFNVCYLL